MNHSTVSGCGEIEHSENSRKSGQQKKSNRPEAVGDLYRTHFENRSSPLPVLCDTAKKKAAATSLPQLFGGSWWIRKPRSKKQSAGLFFAVCGRPTCSNPTSSSTKKDPQPKLRVLFGGSWWIRTTEALSSRFTVCPHWPLGKAPIFCFVSAVSPGDVCYYSKGVSKLQAFF